VKAHGHAEVVDAAVAPTCTETGLTEGKHCSVCDEVLIARTVIAPKGHTYSEIITAPTCTEQGFTTHACVCGDAYIDSYVEATGHADGEFIVDVPASKNGEGKGRIVCVACGYTMEHVTIPATGSIGLAYRVVSADACVITGMGTCTDTEVYIPKTIDAYQVIGIDDYAFAAQTAITELILPDTIETIGSYAFSGCSRLKKVVVPSGITSIPNNCFEGCTGVTELTIPDSVGTIGASAFSGCQKLKNIYYVGTVEQWNAIEKEDTWSDGTRGFNVICTDGEIEY
jgi:hypothetical protein